MFLIGDIGNTEVKIILFNNKKKIIKKIILKNNKIINNFISNNLKLNQSIQNKIKKILFSSVVPSVFSTFKSFF